MSALRCPLVRAAFALCVVSGSAPAFAGGAAIDGRSASRRVAVR